MRDLPANKFGKKERANEKDANDSQMVSVAISQLSREQQQ